MFGLRFDCPAVMLNCTLSSRVRLLATGVICTHLLTGCATPRAPEPTESQLSEVRSVSAAEAAAPEFFAADDLQQLKLLRAWSAGERHEWIQRRREDWMRSSAFSNGVTSDAGILGLDHALTGSQAALRKLAMRYLHDPLPPEVGAFLSSQSLIEFSRLQGNSVSVPSTSVHLHPLWWIPQGCSVYVNGILQPQEQSGLPPQRLAADDVLLVVQWCPPGFVRSMAHGRIPVAEKRLFVAYPGSDPVVPKAVPHRHSLADSEPTGLGGMAGAGLSQESTTKESARDTPLPFAEVLEMTLSLGRFSLGERPESKAGAVRGDLAGLDFSLPLTGAFGLTAGMAVLRPDARRQRERGSAGGAEMSLALRPSLHGQWVGALGVAQCGLRLGAGILSAHRLAQVLSAPMFLGGEAFLRPFCSVSLPPWGSFRSPAALVWGAQFWHILPPFDGWGAEFLLGVHVLF